MAEHVEGWIEFPIVVDKVENAPKSVEWHFNFRSPFTKEQHGRTRTPRQ